jgi:CHASE3 domain sensor protein
VAAYLTQRGVSNSTNWVLHTYDVRSELQNLQTQLAEIRASALAYSGSGDEFQLQFFRQHSQYISNAFEDLRKLTADNPQQQQRLSELESISKDYISQLQGHRGVCGTARPGRSFHGGSKAHLTFASSPAPG